MKRLMITLVALHAVSTLCVAQKDPHWWKNRNTIVHLFEWKWKDVADECERFLQRKGYAGVQISPPNEYVSITNHPWYERYQPISYVLTTRSGNEADFLDMTTRCNAVGIRIYVDAVINHMSGVNQHNVGTAGNAADPLNRYYPAVPYGPSDFNRYCIIQGEDYQHNVDAIRNCYLLGLNDLNQGRENVRGIITQYLNNLVDLGVAGFRIDGAKHMWPGDLRLIYGNIKNLNTSFGFAPNSKPFIYQEVIDLGGAPISSNEYVSLGVVTEFKYSMEIGRVFKGNVKLTYLSNWGSGWGFLSSEDALVFVDNHDNQRENGENGNILTHKNSKRYKMATAFMLAYPYGITRIMSSYAFEDANQGPPDDGKENILSPTINPDNTCGGGWICEHRWRQIYNMIGFKNAVSGTGVNDWWTNGDQQIAFCRGDKGFVAFTNWGDLRQVLQTCLPAGTYCDVISGDIDSTGKCTGKQIVVGTDGKALVELFYHDEDGVLAIHHNSKK